MPKESQILLVEDDEGHAKLVTFSFKKEKEKYRLQRASNLAEARRMLVITPPDLILSDLLLPDGRGIELLPSRRAEACDHDNIGFESPMYSDNPPPFPMVVMTSHGDEKIAVEAMKAGAMDYVVKSPDTFRDIPRIVERVLREWDLIKKRKQAEDELKRLNQQLEEANRKLERLANYDPLTGVANRRSFIESLNQEWRRAYRNSQPISIIMIDVDFFKAYNDSRGHQAGDDCLRRIASLLKQSLTRTGDVLARYGGEEFVVILPATNNEGSHAVARRLRECIESARMPHGDSVVSEYITISLGTATHLPQNGDKPGALISAADSALYLAKRNGRNRCEQG